MKKFIKIFFLSLFSFLGIVIVAICIVLWLVFTPERLTPIVRKQASKFLTCKSDIGSVELTFFSTFPKFGLKLKEFDLVNPVTGSPNDTLVKINELVGVIDAKAYWKNKDIVLIGLEMNTGSVNVYADSTGNTNYNITPADTSTVNDTSEIRLPFIDIRNIELKDVSIHYNDMSLKLNTVISDMSAKISGIVRQDTISGTVKVSTSVISIEYAGEKYLQKGTVRLDLPMDIIAMKSIRLHKASASLNDMELMLDGTIENDSAGKSIIADLMYRFSSWPVENILSLVPQSYRSYLDGLDAKGFLSSDGSIKGIYNDKHMPLLDIHMLLEKGTLKYSAFPLPLHDLEGDLNIRTDLATDSLTFVRINHFEAKTLQSGFETSGMITHLFNDITCNLTSSSTGLMLDEFNSMIPQSMKTTIKGKASGQLKSRFTMSQVEKMQIEKMKISGSFRLSDFDVRYDSIMLRSDRSTIEFALPDNNQSSKGTKFVFASIKCNNATAGKISGYNASLKKASLILETSDLRDSTRIPDLICSFSMDSLSAGMNDMTVAIQRPYGKVSLSPAPDNNVQPHISLSYNSGELKSTMGRNAMTVKKLSTDLDITNDNTQTDIFLQWLVKGNVDFDGGIIRMSELTHAIEIPSVKMDFDPETFSIQESRMKIGKSDFQLRGNLNNVLSYFRGDSILRGKFNFISGHTDVAQLMALTSGIGSYDSTSVNKYEDTKVDTVSTGPYMVPKKIDMLLNTDVKLATMGVDTATNIRGAVQIHDGILLLDALTFDTPAARMQLTAMYRTPRKNHLFLGIDYHMMDVEIGELLTMIPDIDSLMPMLRSFGGRGEFHIAAETYLDSLYNIKKSTLRGAASISGNNLTLMDGETFSEIAKTLKFSKKTQNRVDSLSAEFTIFRNEIDIYPFLIVMDKYKAVIAGRHNFDLTYDYHVSVVDCPLPIKLGVDIKGNANNMSYKLAKCRYAEYFRPSSRHEVENKQLELRKMIRQTLAEKVKQE
jgi:hypothetical protein